MVNTHDFQLDLIIYLRCPPERCYKRMLSRSRPEETSSLTLVSLFEKVFVVANVTIFFLKFNFQEHFKRLHELHEKFLNESGQFRTKYNIPVLVIDSLDSLDEMQKAALNHSKIIMDSLQSRAQEQQQTATPVVC